MGNCPPRSGNNCRYIRIYASYSAIEYMDGGNRVEDPNVTNPEDVIYLKHFVKQHPGNKMGWYLLGKHYRQVGKEGKANYCFIQAGDIYDAFEQESHPLVITQEQLSELRAWGKKEKRKRLARNVVVIALPLLLLVLLMPSLEIKKNVPTGGASQVVVHSSPKLGVIMVPRKEKLPAGYAFGEVLKSGQQAPSAVVAVHMEEKSGWKQWNGNTRLLMEMNRGERSSQYDVMMLDRDTCVCEPADSKPVASRYAQWRQEQELHWTLSSAIMQFRRIYGKWPESLDSLVRPYPNNILSGEDERMKALFAPLLDKIKKSVASSGEINVQSGTTTTPSAPDEKPGPASAASIGSNGLYDPNWSKPLEIVVDVSNHTLAVVHNGLIVRGYRVGLGGEKTPEGSFFISEKVRDPNGGESIFGTRGMTLSNTLYAIHGTDDPDSIGKDESLGCIRMGQEDVEELFDLVPLGTPVHIKNGTLPPDAKTPQERFRLTPKQDESNPAKVYKWLA
ncbi:L,D-transpeptidase [Paenibacillus sp. strain BS8-2]